MPVIQHPEDFHVEDLYLDLRPAVGRSLYLKCEGLNLAGSIKLKVAAAMVAAAERDGVLREGSVLVESSSGNLGVALSMIAANRGYRFVCVTDTRCNEGTRRLMETLGAQVHIISEPDSAGGLLAARIDHVRRLCAADTGYVWLNQYANENNWLAHYRATAPAIARQFPDLEVLFVGAGTTGTLMGCARWFRERNTPVTIVAVDAAGSTTFGGVAGQRMIPGLGTSVRPPLLDLSYVDDVVLVPEPDAIRACHRLAGSGFLLGGSSGSVIAGATSWLAEHRPDEPAVAVAISPDLGERYLDTVYHEDWVRDRYAGVAGSHG